MTSDNEHEETIQYLRALPYEQYLQSKHWREDVRPAAIERADRRCQLCGRKTGVPWPLNVHHNTYDRLGAELDSDVIVLCQRCHERHHTEPVFTTYTGLVCPNCTTEFVARLSIICEVTE